MKKEGIEGYDQLINRSGSDFAWFWQAVLKDLDIRFYTPYEKIVDLEKGIAATEYLRSELTGLLVDQLGKPLKPKEIKFVDALPKTRNAKVMHRVIRAIYLGKDPGDLSSLENSKMIEAIRNAK